MTDSSLLKYPKGSVAISNRTSFAVEGDIRFYDGENPYQFASFLLSLDSFIHAILLSEKVYAISNCRVGIEHRPLIDNHPELPVEVIPPKPIDETGFPREELRSILLSNMAFQNLTRNEETEIYNRLKPVSTYELRLPEDTTNIVANITVGDLWRSMNLGLPFFANQIETPICMYDQIVRLNQLGNFSKSMAQTVGEMTKFAWKAKASDANKLKGYHFFTINMPLFLLEILRECNNPEDLWTIAMQRRNERDVKFFREWCANIDTETNLNIFSKEISNLSETVNSMISDKAKSSSEASLELGLSPTLSIPLSSFQNIKEKIYHSDKHLRFLKRLLRNSIEQGKLDSEISRVFHIKPDKAHFIVNIIDQMDTTSA